ncbi:uncharacterized protein LOC134844698 isoform X2 [Symsagittifera roscoffensis]|uniref:uncharacterized protein LOC134844698 isoform X2 n=1 Tax=Symsagittifera roscoffensis TaxID=84072 RepID=UPI00307B25D5
MRFTREKFILRVAIFLALLPSLTVSDDDKGCPQNFIEVNEFCVTKFNDFTRQGSFDEAWGFCNSFNPTGFKGTLWAISELDDLTENVLLSLVHPEIDDSDSEIFNLPIWNGFDSVFGETSEDLCSVIKSKQDQLIISETNCNDTNSFICAIKRHPAKCTDFINSQFCQLHSNYFCETTGQLATLCPHTCGLCELIHSCDGKIDLKSDEFCHDLAGQGFCGSDIDNIEPFCSLTCCRHTHEATLAIGDKSLSEALNNDCEGTRDLAKCPSIPNTEDCFRDSDFTFACMRTCCLYSQSIREVALEVMPKKRFSSFDDNIAEANCRNKYDDTDKSVCSQDELDCTSEKIQIYCEETCCIKEYRDENPDSIGEITETTEEAPSCDELTNIYSNKVCSTPKSADDCAEYLQFSKHCKKRCCELGFSKSRGMTEQPGHPCVEHTDKKMRCARYSEKEKEEVCKDEACPYTCCMYETGTMTVSSVSSTSSVTSTKASSNCNGKEDTMTKCSKVTEKMCEQNVYKNGCPYSCCKLTGGDDGDKGKTESPDSDCRNKEDTMSKCSKVTASLCKKNVYKKGCPLSCCTVSGGSSGDGNSGTSSGSKATSKPNTGCSDVEDQASKCAKLATEKKCYEDPYKSVCKKTCCEFGVAAYTDEPPSKVSKSSEAPCNTYSDSLSKCHKVKDKQTCKDEPYYSGCRETCCELGADYSKPKGTTTAKVPGDICVDKEDQATKCMLLKQKSNPKSLCENDQWYIKYCPLTCCVLLYEPSTTLTTTKPMCDEEDEFHKCDQIKLTKGLCKSRTFKTKCAYSCCVVSGGEVPTSKQSTTGGSTLSTSTTTTISTTSKPYDGGFFEKCTVADTESKEFCAAVIQTHVKDTGDLCQDIHVRPKCMFSCCVYYYATDEKFPQLPEPLEPEKCKNLVDGLPYKECLENYLEAQCDINCQLTCCLMAEAEVPVNPGCYNKDDKAKEGYCLTKCRSGSSCRMADCVEKCSFTCCVIHTDPEKPSTTTKAVTGSRETTKSSQASDKSTTESSDCEGLTDEKPIKCLDEIKDASFCNPTTTMYDNLGCNRNCCYAEAKLLTTIGPSTTGSISTSGSTSGSTAGSSSGSSAASK